MYHIFLICSLVNGYLGGFRILALVNSDTVNIGVHGPFQDSVFVLFFGYIIQNETPGSCGSSLFRNSFPQMDFPGGSDR